MRAALGRRVEQPVDQRLDARLHRAQGARRERRRQQLADAGVDRRIVEHEARGVVLVEQAVAEIRLELDFLVRAPGRGVAIDLDQIVVAGEEIRAVRHAVHRIVLAQRAVGRVGIVEKCAVEVRQIERGSLCRRRQHDGYASPLARACSSAITAQSLSPSPCATAPTRRSRQTLPLGSGTPASVAGFEREVGVLQTEHGHLADLGVALVDDDLAVDLVGRAVEQAVGHHVVEHAGVDAVFAGQREAFAHRLDGAAEHEVVGDLDGGRRLPDRRRPRRCGGRCASNSGLHLAIASGGPDANTPAVPAATSSGRPSIGAATRTWPGLGVQLP